MSLLTAVLGVQFVPHGTVHLLRAGDVWPCRAGDQVLYPTEDGTAVATVAWVGQVADASGAPVCPGRAQSRHFDCDRADRLKRAEIDVAARRLIAEHDLPMKVLAVDYVTTQASRPLAVVYYTAPCRVDFRRLLVDLGQVLGCRLDLRQVGDRDAAQLLVDVGACGRPACCTGPLLELQPVGGGRSSMEAGACGRAMCCMRFEEADES
ncbi:MAG: regulatory iron-sulfur-containing complex subunit RicT [Brooklawnia sp.]